MKILRLKADIVPTYNICASYNFQYEIKVWSIGPDGEKTKASYFFETEEIKNKVLEINNFIIRK